MAVVIFLGLFTGYKTVYAATSDLSDYEKEILNAYLYSISDRSSKWIRPYTYEGIKYDFVNCKEERLDFNYEAPRHCMLTLDFLYFSYGKKYDIAKKMDYLEVTGILILQDDSIRMDIENVHQSPPGGRDDWGTANIGEVTLYKVTLGIYIKEVDGTLYAYGEKYKFKDITDKDIITSDGLAELKEEEYIKFATWLNYELWDDMSIKMEDMYGLENPPLKKWKVADGYYIPIVEKYGWGNHLGCKRYLPAGWLEGVWHEYSIGLGEDHENPELTGNIYKRTILKK